MSDRERKKRELEARKKAILEAIEVLSRLVNTRTSNNKTKKAALCTFALARALAVKQYLIHMAEKTNFQDDAKYSVELARGIYKPEYVHSRSARLQYVLLLYSFDLFK